MTILSRPAVARASAALFALMAVVAWEVTTPRLPVRFEPPAAHVWLPRLLMAGVGALGIAAVFGVLARLVDRRTGAYAAAVLATTPAWFVPARTSTGAIIPMAEEAIVLALTAFAALDERAGRGARGLALLGALGVAAASASSESRGLVVVVAPAALGVGFAGLGARHRREPLVVLAVGIALLGVTLGTFGGDSRLAVMLAGHRDPSAHATFDAPVSAVAYALLPWTPLLPLAFSRRQETPATRAFTLAAALAIGAHALVATRGGAGPLVGVAPVACAVALALRAIGEVRRVSVTVLATVAVASALVVHDLELQPERVLSTLGAGDAALPAALAASRAVRSVTWLASLLGVAALAVPRAWLPTDRGLAVLAAGALAGCALRGYAYPLLLTRLSPGEAFEAYLARHADGEPLGTLGSAAAPRGAVGSSGALGVEAPPKALDNADRAAAWLAESAEPGGSRRFLAIDRLELPALTAAYRARRGANVPILAGGDGTVLLAASVLHADEVSESPLDAVVMSAPPAGLRPLSATFDERVEAVGWDLTDEHGRPLEALTAGRKTHVRIALRVLSPPEPGGSGATPLDRTCTFLHLETAPTRITSERRDRAYPAKLWRAGDVVIDDLEVTLPPRIGTKRPALYFGLGVLPCEDDHRLPITKGPSDGHGRASAGAVEVR